MMKRVRTLLVVALLATSVHAEPKVNGRIEQIGTIRTLRVWGTPRQMGYAHGFLFADDIAETIEDVLSAFYPDDPERYQQTRAALLNTIDWPADAKAELDALFEGVKTAKEKAPDLPRFKRPLQPEDIFFFNALDVLRAFGCSGFTVWGDEAGDAGVITGRNFDFSVFSKRVLDDQMLIVRQPDGRHQVATVSWPGYIGAYTGVNDGGVAAFLHDGNGRVQNKPGGKHVPLAIVVKRILETVEPREAHTSAGDILRKTSTPYSYLVRLVVPRIPGAIEFPATVFRLDSAGFGANPISGDRCITTNHYVGAAGKPPVDSARRFKTIKHILGASAVSRRNAWAALQAVAAKGRSNGTLHALMYYPEQRRMELALATWGDELIPAPMNPPAKIALNRLFARGK